MGNLCGGVSDDVKAEVLKSGASFRFFMLQADYAYIAYELTPVQYLSLIVRF